MGFVKHSAVEGSKREVLSSTLFLPLIDKLLSVGDMLCMRCVCCLLLLLLK